VDVAKGGAPRETVNELSLSAGKVVATSYSAPTIRTSTVGISMKFMVPLCADHKAQEEEHLIAAMDYLQTTDRFHSTVCEVAMGELAKAGFESAAPAIVNTFIANIHVNDKVCNAAAKALKTLAIPEPLDAKTVEQLKEGLKYSSIRGAVVTILGLSSIGHLIAALDNQDAGVRNEVVYALGQTRNKEAVPALIERLSDTEKNWGTRVCEEAARSLKLIGTPDALGALEKWNTKTLK
jgi:hypothetical protein